MLAQCVVNHLFPILNPCGLGGPPHMSFQWGTDEVRSANQSTASIPLSDRFRVGIHQAQPARTTPRTVVDCSIVLPEPI